MAAHMELHRTDSMLGEELEVLESIYIHELTVEREDSGRPYSIRLDLHPSTGDDLEKQYVCMTLVISPTLQYPDESPQIEIKNPRGISEDEIQRVMMAMRQLAEERQGGPMLYELTEIAKECLTESNIPHTPCAICLEEFTEGDPFMKTDCYHYFHHYCLARYIDYVLNKQEEQDDTKPPGVGNEEQEEEGVVCPICRLSINYDLDLLEQTKEPVAKELKYTVTKESQQHLSQMAEVFARQKANGGIIDLEAEKNKYLVPKDLLISVNTPAVSSADENGSEHKNSKRNYPDRRYERKTRHERPSSRNYDHRRNDRLPPRRNDRPQSRNNDDWHSRKYYDTKPQQNDCPKSRHEDNSHSRKQYEPQNHSRYHENSQSRNNDYPKSRNNNPQSFRNISPHSRNENSQPRQNDNPQSRKNDYSQPRQNDNPQSRKNDYSQPRQNDSPQSRKNDYSHQRQNDNSKSRSKDTISLTSTDNPQTNENNDNTHVRSDSPQSTGNDNSQSKRTDYPKSRRGYPYSKRNDNQSRASHNHPHSGRRNNNDKKHNVSDQSSHSKVDFHDKEESEDVLETDKQKDSERVKADSLPGDKVKSNSNEISDVKTDDRSSASGTSGHGAVNNPGKSSNCDRNETDKLDIDGERNGVKVSSVDVHSNQCDKNLKISDSTSLDRTKSGQNKSRGIYKPRFTSRFTSRSKSEHEPGGGNPSRRTRDTSDDQQNSREQAYSGDKYVSRGKEYHAKNSRGSRDSYHSDYQENRRDRGYCANRIPSRGRGRRYPSTSQAGHNRTPQSITQSSNQSLPNEVAENIKEGATKPGCRENPTKQSKGSEIVKSQSSRPPPGFKLQECKHDDTPQPKPPPGFGSAS